MTRHNFLPEGTHTLEGDPTDSSVEPVQNNFEEIQPQLSSVGFSTEFHAPPPASQQVPQSTVFNATGQTMGSNENGYLLQNVIHGPLYYPNYPQRGFEQRALVQQQPQYDYIYQQQYPYYQRGAPINGPTANSIGPPEQMYEQNYQYDYTQGPAPPVGFYPPYHGYDQHHDFQYFGNESRQQPSLAAVGGKRSLDSQLRARRMDVPHMGSGSAPRSPGSTGSTSGRSRVQGSDPQIGSDMLQCVASDPTVSRVKNNDDVDYSPTTVYFYCPHCHLKFPKQSELQSHLVVHSNSRPFECKFCGSRCKRKSDWLRHMKNHETTGAGSLRYRCGGILNGQEWGCSKNYSRSDARRKHWKGKNGGKCVGQFCLATLSEDARVGLLDKRTGQEVIQRAIKTVRSRYKDSACDLYNDMAANVDTTLI